MQLRKSKTEVRYDFEAGTSHAVHPNADKPRQVGLYAASFDPVHAGHIIFALKAQKLAGLDQVCFLPERNPKQNPEAEHYVHRAIMLKHALKPHRHFSVFDLPDARLSLSGLARVRQELPDAEFSLLTTASELLWHQGELPKLYEKLPLVVAVTTHSQMAEVLARVRAGKTHLQNVTFVDVGKDHISSAAVRSGLRKHQSVRGLLPSVAHYARQQWLYIAPHRS